jgi:UDP-N-acetylglucosamine 2-epimerase (non-hydrolysing)/GDP/UDP-N,N'-diacetylbacillosamine 2-epimerase (hydrolysing)
MHLDLARGRSIDAIRREGWTIDATVPWSRREGDETANAVATGKATAALAALYAKLNPDIILVTGDRVEPFAAATAGHLSGRLVAHVHGGDRALGLVDDSLRHAITKLAHVHFPATRQSADRIERMGEDRWRIFRAGSPGLDDIRAIAELQSRIAAEFPGVCPGKYALLVMHPDGPDPMRQRQQAELLLRCVDSSGFDRVVIVYPNNDPGSDGIARAWDAIGSNDRHLARRDIPRPMFLGLLRHAAVLVGNSSSGIIEAASFGTPVLDIADRQAGRERGENVSHAILNERAICKELRRIWNQGKPIRYPAKNVYGTGGTGLRIARTLARVSIERFRRKLIVY